MDQNTLFNRDLTVINVGVKHFQEALKAQGVETAHVMWKPPVDKKLAALLRKVL